VERVLSAGGFGITSGAYDAQFADRCVVKELALGELMGRDTARGTLVPLPGREPDVRYWVDKVVREARLLNRIRHEGVVSVRAVWVERGTAFYAMDLIDGTEMPRGVTRGWGWSVWEPVVIRMFEALGAIHATGLVHSDIKPSNMLIKPTGQPVFIDFGTARTSEEMQKTRLTTVAFTPGYAPPELEDRERAKEVGPWSDLYSLAMAVIGLFVPHPGLDGYPVEARMRLALSRHSRGAEGYGEEMRQQLCGVGVPDAWAKILVNCVKLAPEERPRDAAEVLSRASRSAVSYPATSRPNAPAADLSPPVLASQDVDSEFVEVGGAPASGGAQASSGCATVFWVVVGFIVLARMCS
jgi:serine/threonine protein kinase